MGDSLVFFAGKMPSESKEIICVISLFFSLKMLKFTLNLDMKSDS